VKRRLILRPAAARELHKAADWYDAREPGLGARLSHEVEKSLARILENPLQFPAWRGVWRRALIDVFPYSLHFRMEGDDVVLVAVFHAKRNPRALSRRR